MIKAKRRNKKYDKRMIVIYENDKPIDYIIPWHGWYAGSQITPETRKLVIEDLYWLVGKDCEYEEWTDTIQKMDEGKRLWGVPVDKEMSLFFNREEKERALNSFFKNKN